MFDSVAVRAGNRRALARLLTGIENRSAAVVPVLADLFLAAGHAHLIGITGPPGSGKSSLVNELAKALRKQQQTVAIVAVDPSSPFTGGAILGDRIRMRDLAGDPGVFIRSMASRGSLGGLARATAEVVMALDAAGFDRILIETVGAGQAEVDIARMAQTTVVIEAPGLGDDVQAIKAGILEIADVLVVNKADQAGAEHTLRALRASLDLAHPTLHIWQDTVHGSDHTTEHHGPQAQAQTVSSPAEAPLWFTPLIATVATQGQGLDALLTALDQHRDHLRTSGEGLRRTRERLTHELETRLRDALLTQWAAQMGNNGQLGTVVDQLLARQVDPHTAAQQLVHQWLVRTQATSP